MSLEFQKNPINFNNLDYEIKDAITNILSGLKKLVDFEIDRYQYFKFEEKVINNRKYQLIIHSQNTYGYSEKYFVETEKILTGGCVVIDLIDSIYKI